MYYVRFRRNSKFQTRQVYYFEKSLCRKTSINIMSRPNSVYRNESDPILRMIPHNPNWSRMETL